MSDPFTLSLAGVKPGMKEVRKEGYLWKINKKKKRRVRKYFVLVAGTLTWTLKPADIKPLGKIPVSSARIKATSSYEFTITSTKNGREKEYLFAAQNPEETRTWMEAIIASQNLSKSKVGWLIFGRDRQRAWFLFSKSVLYWFNKEQDPSGDFRKEVQGVIKLGFYNVNVVSENSFELQDFLPAVAPEEEPKAGKTKLTWDDISSPSDRLTRLGRVFAFTCKSKDELLSWVQAFQDDITKHRKRVNAGTEHFGWLKMKDSKGVKRQFFIIRGGRLAWFRSAEDWSECERGSMLLEQCQVKREMSDTRSFIIYNPSNAAVTLTLTAEKDEEFNKWYQVVEKAVETVGQKVTNTVDEVRTAAVNSRERVEMSGWLILKGKKKFFRLKADVLLYFEDEPRNNVESKLIDSIRLKDAVLTKKEFSFSIKTSDAKLYELAAHSMQEIHEWVVSINAALQQARGIAYAQSKGTAVDPTLMSMFQADLGKQGWVTKEGKKRFLDLAPGRITELDTQFKPKRVVPLESASVSVIDATSFLLRTVGESHVYVCPKEDTADWVKNISFYIIKANAAAATELEKKGWLLINGKSYWCGLKNTKFSWFPQQQLDTYQFPEKSTLSIQECKTQVLPASGTSAAMRFRFQLVPTVGKPVELRADSEVEMNGWLKAFASCLEQQEAARRTKAAATLKTPVFGTELAALLVAEKEVHKATSEIPYVVRRSIEYLDQPKAYETPGLWQTGGSFPKVREWAGALNSGQELNLKDASFHDVTGLVKHFLRSLPEPLMSFSLHDPILDARADSDKLSMLIQQLPAPNRALLKYLMKYLDKLTNQMLEMEEVNAVDLSMVFAPLLFRRKSDPNEAGVDSVKDEEDLDLLKGVLVVGTLIHKYYEIFEGKKPTIKEALGLPEEVGDSEELGNVVSLTSLDALLDNFLNGNTMGLDLTDQQVNRLTLKRNALRAQQKQENNMSDWAKNLKVAPARKAIPDAFMPQPNSAAVADLDNLIGDLETEKRDGRSGSASAPASSSSTPAKPTGGARPPPKIQVAPGDTVRVSAISDLDDLFEEMQTEKADRYRQDTPAMDPAAKSSAVAPEVNKLLAQVSDFRRESIAIRRTKQDTRALVNALETLGDAKKPTPSGGSEKIRIRVFSDDGLAATAWTIAVSEKTTAREVVNQIGKKLPVDKEGNIMLSESDPSSGNLRLVEADEIVSKLKGKLSIASGRGYKSTRSSTAGASAAERVSPGTSPGGSRKGSESTPSSTTSSMKGSLSSEGKHSHKKDREERTGRESSAGTSQEPKKDKEHRDKDEKKEKKEDKLRESAKSQTHETPRSRKDTKGTEKVATLDPPPSATVKDGKDTATRSRRDAATSPRSAHHTRQPSVVGPDDEFAQLASSRHKNDKTVVRSSPNFRTTPPPDAEEALRIEDEIKRNEAERTRLESEIKAHEDKRRQREKEKKDKEERERKEREEKERKDKEEADKREKEERERKEKEERDRKDREREEKEKRDRDERLRKEAEDKKRDEDRRKVEEESRRKEEEKKRDEEKRRADEALRREEERKREEEVKRRDAERKRAEEDELRKKREKDDVELKKQRADAEVLRLRDEERKKIEAQRKAQDDSARLLKESMRTAAKGSGSVFGAVASASQEKNELKATIGEIDALLGGGPLPHTPRTTTPVPTPRSDPIKSTIGEIDALLAQPALGPGSVPNLVVSEEATVSLSLTPVTARKNTNSAPSVNNPATGAPPAINVVAPTFNPRASSVGSAPTTSGSEEFDPRASHKSVSGSSSAGASPSGVRPEDVGSPSVLIVLVNGNPKQIAVTQGLTFQQVLQAIAKSKADEYEIVSAEGLMLAGEVALTYAGKKEAKCVLQKAEVLL